MQSCLKDFLFVYFLCGRFSVDDYPLVVKEHTAWDLVGAEDRIDAKKR